MPILVAVEGARVAGIVVGRDLISFLTQGAHSESILCQEFVVVAQSSWIAPIARAVCLKIIVFFLLHDFQFFIFVSHAVDSLLRHSSRYYLIQVHILLITAGPGFSSIEIPSLKFSDTNTKISSLEFKVGRHRIIVSNRTTL